LIFGHNNNEIFSLEDYKKMNEEKFDEVMVSVEIDSYGEENINHVFENLNEFKIKSKKNPSRQMEKYHCIFSKINKFSRIIILGHSLGNVDSEYFFRIFNAINSDAEIIISYHREDGRKNLEKQLIKYNICNDIKFITLSDMVYYD
jgi:hypothetical protein